MLSKISWTGIFSARAVTGHLCCLMVASSIGCATGAGLQDAQYCLANKTRAEISWLTCNDWKQRWDLGSDYAKGYKKGFYEASTGRGCKLPAVPPPCYWSSKYQSCEGQEAIAAWYRGYQCGAAAAEGNGYPSFHEVPVGPCAPSINQTGCQGCYSPDYCACSGGAHHQPSVDTGLQTPELQFHGGLFGQYGSALATDAAQAGNADTSAAAPYTPSAPATSLRANSVEDTSASDDSARSLQKNRNDAAEAVSPLKNE